jgi:hypothetical protein
MQSVAIFIARWSVVLGLSLTLGLVACSDEKKSNSKKESGANDQSETISEMKGWTRSYSRGTRRGPCTAETI